MPSWVVQLIYGVIGAWILFYLLNPYLSNVSSDPQVSMAIQFIPVIAGFFAGVALSKRVQ